MAGENGKLPGLAVIGKFTGPEVRGYVEPRGFYGEIQIIEAAFP